MKKTAVFDIEATNWIDFACLGFFDGDDYQVFWAVEDFLNHFLTRKYRGYNCFAHFGGKYDFRFLIPILCEAGRFELRFLERGSRIMSIKVRERKTGLSWKFSDSYFLLPSSLRELAKNFQIEHMKEELDFSRYKQPSDFNTPEAQRYLRNDCLGLYEILEKFSKWGLNGGKLKSTLPSQSMHVFNTGFNKERFYGLTQEQETFIRSTYFGGRTEIFKMYGENLYYYDINSLYPFVMLEDMPCGSPMYTKSFYPSKIGFYRITANIPDMIIPPLAAIIKGKLFFPVGPGEYMVTSADIEILQKYKIPFYVCEGIVFDRKEAYFKEYIEKMYELRQTFPKGSMENLVAKLLMNSLYGKYGQKRLNTELIFSYEPSPGARPFDERFGLYEITNESKSLNIFPYIASYITSRARAILYSYFEAVGQDNVWYCDTDSIITNKKIDTGEGIGKLKLEYEIKEAVFFQPKAYCLKLHDGKEIVKVKGMKDVKISMKIFKKAMEEKNMSLVNSKYYHICGFRECIKRDKDLSIKRREVFKQLNSVYNKRIILNNYLTKPFNYSILKSDDN